MCRQRIRWLGCMQLIVLALLGAQSHCFAQSTNVQADAAQEHILPDAFKSRDTDANGKLTQAEFVAGGEKEKSVLHRDFLVFDANHDGELTVAEFLSVPGLCPEDQRTAVPDPVIALVNLYHEELLKLWSEGDQNNDGSLTATEFAVIQSHKVVPGLRGLKSEDWDLDGDGAITKVEVRRLLEIAFGVRSPSGDLLRSKQGRVIDWRMFRAMSPDADGKVAREKYISAMGSVELAEKWFPTINAEGNERFSSTEFFKSGHRTDPANTFLDLDVDLNGYLTPQELEGLPQGWAPPGRNWLEGFDDDKDKVYSLKEFCLLPHVNLLASWQAASDVNQDGKLTVDEFRFAPSPILASLAAEYFRRLDLDGDGYLTVKEWAFQTNHPDARFFALDTDGNGELTEAEFSKEKSLPADRLHRDFVVFDADGNGVMTKTEFLTIPYWVPEGLRSPVHDPVVALSRSYSSKLKEAWGSWDKDDDGQLSAAEFASASIEQRVSGLDTSIFDQWDLDHNSKVSTEEVERVLDCAFGVTTANGERLRSISGFVIDWRGFRGLDPDGDGRVTRDEYMHLMRGVPNPEEWYRRIAKDDAADFGVADFMHSPHHTDPVEIFLRLDVDMNARLTPEELTGIPAEWGPPSKRWLSGFDDDRDGGYSLHEFMLIPHVNLLASWHDAEDKNQDGKLSLEEFRFIPLPALASLSAEYFRRIDLNRDGSLSLDEWPFRTSHPSARFTKLDANGDAELTEVEFVAEGSLPADRLARDFKVFDHDANGRMTFTEFLTIPHWVAEIHRTPIPDPVVRLSVASLLILTSHWDQWDQDSDGFLSQREFEEASLVKQIPGLDASEFQEWDLDRDGRLARQESALLLDIAYGIRVATGELLRTQSADVYDWNFFRSLDPDGNGRVSREDYLKRMNSTPNADEWYRSMVKDGSEGFGIAEYVQGNHRTAPIYAFLEIDRNLDGHLSPEELTGIPWGPSQKKWLPGFDDDGDGAFSLREYLLLPYLNLVATWHAAVDANGDGLLSKKEFAFASTPALAAITAEYFRRLDLNGDQSLSLGEWPFQTSNPIAKFNALDRDGDGELTEAEFIAEGSLPVERLRRDFKIFDIDANGQMTQSEFMAIPHWVSANERTSIPDPVVKLSQGSFSDLMMHWSEWDADTDSFLNASEFKAAAVGRRIPGLEFTVFNNWDLSHDGKVSKDEVELVLDIAFGVRAPTGEPLRSKVGQIVDWRGFQGLHPDKNGKVSRAAYIKSQGPSFDAVRWFPTIFAEENESFGVAEFLTSNHKTDPVSQFISMDVDLNGRLSPAELEAIPPGWGPPGRNFLAGFDDDGDGSYSLKEFRLIPQVNLLATWHAAQDKDNDGKLSPLEFRFMPAPVLASLTAEYFRRLDVDKDGFLSTKEWSFNFDPARVPRAVVLHSRDRNGDNRLSLDEVFGEHRRPEGSTPTNQGVETTLVRIEEAFRRADKNKDGFLDQNELSSNDGIEALAPGALVQSKSTAVPPVVPIANALGMDEMSVRTFAIIEFNILLVVGVGIYLYRKHKAAQ